ncbi:MAG: hypothetical protein ACI8S6_005866 [Myxococcota bacterium]|jgi:hypothetical protein
MNIRDLILLALAAPTVACPSTWNCRPDSESFSLQDEDIIESTVEEVMAA